MIVLAVCLVLAVGVAFSLLAFWHAVGAILGAIVVAYELFVRWQMRQPKAVKYNPHLARFVRRFTGPRMIVIALWRIKWLLDPPGVRVLSPISHKHEDVHIDIQWAKYPRSYPFRYHWQHLRFGYDGNWFEEIARYISGQPLRSTGKQRERVNAWIILYRAQHPGP